METKKINLEKINSIDIITMGKVLIYGILAYLILKQLTILIRGYGNNKKRKEKVDMTPAQVTEYVKQDTSPTDYNYVKSIQGTRDKGFDEFWQKFFKENPIKPTITEKEAREKAAAFIAKVHELVLTNDEVRNLINMFQTPDNFIYAHYVNGITPYKTPTITQMKDALISLGVYTASKLDPNSKIIIEGAPEFLNTLYGHANYYTPTVIKVLFLSNERGREILRKIFGFVQRHKEYTWTGDARRYFYEVAPAW
jgi:hypothetical protein